MHHTVPGLDPRFGREGFATLRRDLERRGGLGVRYVLPLEPPLV